MPKVKVPRKSMFVDMTAMCDVAFLLLTFFILTSKFKTEEPVIVDTPSSVSEIKLPDVDIMLITVDKEGKIFFNIDGQFKRKELIEKMDEKFALGLTEEQKIKFALGSSFGVPMGGLKQYLSLSHEEQLKVVVPGIPADTARNELADWILYGRITNPKIRIAIKADQDANYPAVGKVIKTLQDRKVNKFNLITDLEANPNKLAGVKAK